MLYRGFTILTDGSGNYKACKDIVKHHNFLGIKWKTKRRVWINKVTYDEDDYGPGVFYIESSPSIASLKKDIDYHIDGWQPVGVN